MRILDERRILRYDRTMIRDSLRTLFRLEERSIATIIPSTISLTVGDGSALASSPDRSLAVPAFYAGANMIIDAFAPIPWDAYRGNIPSDPVPPILRRPDPFEHVQATRRKLATSLLIHGNAYAYLTAPDRSGRPTVAIPIPAYEVNVSWNDSRTRPVYRWRGREMILNESILHMKMTEEPGWLLGLGPVAATRVALSASIEEQRQALEGAGNGGVPDGVVAVPGKLTKDEAELIRNQWDDQHKNKRGVAFLTGGMSWQSVRMSNADMQFLESREFGIRDIARMLRIPAALLNAQNDGSSLTYRNQEGVWTEFTRTAVEPIAERFEETFGELLPSTREIRHDYSRLLRADVQTRYNTYAIARQNGILTANEIRRNEGLDPLEGGDRLDFRVEEEIETVTGSTTGDPDIQEANINA